MGRRVKRVVLARHHELTPLTVSDPRAVEGRRGGETVDVTGVDGASDIESGVVWLRFVRRLSAAVSDIALRVVWLRFARRWFGRLIRSSAILQMIGNKAVRAERRGLGFSVSAVVSGPISDAK